MPHALLIAALLLGRATPQWAGEEVVRAMYDRYAGGWYTNLALVQTVKYHDAETGSLDSVRVWYESIQLPGTVRSDIAPLDAGNAQLYVDGTWTVFEADTLVRSFQRLHPVLLLGFDVYVQPVQETLVQLQRLGVDLAQVRRDEWQGREVHVVGGNDRQFWVDVDDLLLRRLLLQSPSSGAVREVRFDRYRPLGGGWIATELEFWRDGVVDIHERYDYWTIDVEFEPDLFATRDRTRPAWIRN